METISMKNSQCSDFWDMKTHDLGGCNHLNSNTDHQILKSLNVLKFFSLMNNLLCGLTEVYFSFIVFQAQQEHPNYHCATQMLCLKKSWRN